MCTLCTLTLQLFAAVAVAEIQFFSCEVLMWNTSAYEGRLLLVRFMFLSGNAVLQAKYSGVIKKTQFQGFALMLLRVSF